MPRLFLPLHNFERPPLRQIYAFSLDAASAFEGDLDDDETTALMLGVRLLDAVASKLLSKDVYSRGMNAVQKLAGSNMPYQRAIAYRSMAIMVDGCRNEVLFCTCA